MKRYEQHRSRDDRDRDPGVDERWGRGPPPDRNETPPRSGFYPSAGYGFNPGEYESGESSYNSRDADRDREYRYGSREPYEAGANREPGGPSWRGGERYTGRDWSQNGAQGYGASSSNQPRRYRPGPKGYTRSDERVREDISERLMSSHDIDSSEVTVNVKDGKVTLEGTVPDRWMKHAIEDTADRCGGVRDVDNRIRVGPEELRAPA